MAKKNEGILAYVVLGSILSLIVKVVDFVDDFIFGHGLVRFFIILGIVIAIGIGIYIYRNRRKRF